MGVGLTVSYVVDESYGGGSAVDGDAAYYAWGLGPVLDFGEGVAVDDAVVFDFEAWYGVDVVDDPLPGLFYCLAELLALAEDVVDVGGYGFLFGGEEGVAATHGEAAVFADYGAGDNLYVEA